MRHFFGGMGRPINVASQTSFPTSPARTSIFPLHWRRFWRGAGASR
ncbi:hypothetical protein Pd630_LPD10059 (plasmid) [Rhodococcus opacus PD630]|nr:hypothetical protein Pd630_LPD10059 [Rhodococcus opacus PD630]